MNYLFSEYPGINRPTQTMICHSIKSKELPENIVNCVTNKEIANVLGIKCNSNKNNWPKEFTSNDTWIIAYLISPEEEARIKECLPIKYPSAINQHLKSIYEQGEPTEEATIKKNLIVQEEGMRSVSREVSFYNLDAIIAVGYRVNSKRATAFRIWATKVLRDYMVKGFALCRLACQPYSRSAVSLISAESASNDSFNFALSSAVTGSIPSNL